jgi:hypothetical protein
MTVLLQPAPLRYWQLSETLETRYDVPDQSMQGEMDSSFFLTKDRNFIPHEYPCRTQFGRERRGRRPTVRGDPAFVENWLPFESTRLDRSGFWFRPTCISGWARTVVRADCPGTARLRLTTCGGAVLFANGTEVGWIAEYLRNKPSQVDLDVLLKQGRNELLVFFDDLAERDARFYIELAWLGGPQAREALPFDADEALVRSVEETLSAMRFERPAYTGGVVAVVLQRPLPLAAQVEIAVQGDFVHRGRLKLTRDLTAGSDRLVIGQAEDLPADFLHFHLTFEVDGFVASRTLGVEITHADAQGDPPGDRIAEALEASATRGARDTVCALARLATGRNDSGTEAMIEDALGPIDDCWDCADFALVPLIWARTTWGEHLSDDLRRRIDQAILGYRYWMDEPGNDVQWYFSENHALLFHTAAYLAGNLLPEATFHRSGRPGAEQSDVGRDRLLAWLDHFERWEMAEFNSAPYFPVDLKGLTALFALAPHRDIRQRASRGIVRLIEIVANSAHHGILTAAQGRSYEHSLRSALSLELSAIARLLWSRGTCGSRFHALPQLALCIRDHGLQIPDFTERAILTAPVEHEWTFSQGQDSFAKIYHCKTRAWAMGTAAGYRWGEWGYQETLIHARVGTEPQAQVWINHPGEAIHSGYGRPSYWGGSASVPRVHQYRGLAVVAFDGVEPQPDFTHAWFPRPVFDEAAVDGTGAFARSGRGALAILADGALEEVRSGPTAGCELRLAGRKGIWLMRVGELAAGDALDTFRRRFTRIPTVIEAGGAIVVADPEYGRVVFRADATVEAEGRVLDPSRWSVKGERLESARNMPVQEAH